MQMEVGRPQVTDIVPTRVREVLARRRPTALRTEHVPLALGMLVLAALAALNIWSSHQARNALEERFAGRATTGAALMSEYVTDVAQRVQLVGRELAADETISPERAARIARVLGAPTAGVIDGDGHLLAIHPHDEDAIGTNVAAKYPHIARAVGGDIGVSPVVDSISLGREVVAVAAPAYQTLHGPRVLSHAFVPDEMPFQDLLGSISPIAGTQAFLFDASGALVADTTELPRVVHDAQTIAVGSYGPKHVVHLDSGEREYAASAEPVAGTTWQLVLMAPLDTLHAPLGGWAGWGVWFVWASVAIAVVAMVRLLMRLRQREVALQELNDALDASNSDLQQFAYVASHDLQEPLRVISGFSDIIVSRYAGVLDDQGRQHFGYITDASQRLQVLIRDLLAYTRVQSRAGEVETIDLQDVANRALANLATAVSESGAQMDIGDLPRVCGDPSQLTILLQNLIHNAIKFSASAAPVVRISAVVEEGSVVVSVADNGIGIDPQFRQRVFGIFQRLHTRDEYPGTGMGLAICNRIVERHGGRIWAAESELGGAMFSFTLEAV